MHQATGEAADLKRKLAAILNDPLLGPLAAATAAPGTPGADPGGDPELRKAWTEYQEAPNDEAAFLKLMAVAEQRGSKRALAELDKREIEQVNRARVQQQNVVIARTINDTVKAEAPDVDLDLFWSFGRQAQAETPVHLTAREDRITWQKDRMIALTRAKQQALVNPAVQAALEAERVKAGAAPVMPGGGTARPAAAGAPAAAEAPNMVDQVRALRRSVMGPG